MLNNIEKLRFYCQKILPLVYDDSLSYVEVLYKMNYKLNEIITSYNELITFYNSVEGTLEEINGKIIEIDNRLDGFTNELISFEERITTELNVGLETLDNKFNTLSAELQNEINALSSRIENELRTLTIQLQDMINTQLRLIREEVQLNNEEMREWVEVRLDEFLAEIPAKQNVMVIDPLTGKLVKLQDCIDGLFQYMRYGGITAQEYDNLGLTAEEYDTWVVNSIPRGLTAYEYDFYARKYFGVDGLKKIYHPKNGNMVEQQVVIYFNNDLLKTSGSLNAQEYDDLLIDAETYDGLSITAYQYDWESNRKLVS